MKANKPANTGERMFNKPGSTDYIVSLKRYKFAAKYVRNKTVLDISCGVGYGTKYLSRFAKKVVGVDVDGDTINYCEKNIKVKNINFQLIDSNGILKRELVDKFDVIVSIETIEHVKDASLFLKNLKFYLKNKKGIIILTTPNNFEKIHPSANIFHTYEFDILELHELLMRKFKDFNVDLYGQRRTGISRADKRKHNEVTRVTILISLLGFIWKLGYKYLGIFRKIEDWKLYKKVGEIQRRGDNDFNIYKIDNKNNFINPVTAVFVIEKT